MFFGISLFFYSLPPHTLYKQIVAVKATIDKQSPHGKLLFESGGGGVYFPNGLCFSLLMSLPIAIAIETDI